MTTTKSLPAGQWEGGEVQSPQLVRGYVLGSERRGMGHPTLRCVHTPDADQFKEKAVDNRFRE
jgi:hypothetical protein